MMFVALLAVLALGAMPAQAQGLECDSECMETIRAHNYRKWLEMLTAATDAEIQKVKNGTQEERDAKAVATFLLTDPVTQVPVMPDFTRLPFRKLSELKPFKAPKSFENFGVVAMMAYGPTMGPEMVFVFFDEADTQKVAYTKRPTRIPGEFAYHYFIREGERWVLKQTETVSASH